MTAESGAQAAQGGLAQGTHRAATILHISDLHFGWGFSEDLWQGLCDLAAGEIKPDLVIATGDFVHSPFRWRLATARKGLQGLQDQIRHANAACQIIAVAGNHDTRIQGLLPVRWILPVLLALVLLAGLIGWWVANFQWLVWVLVGAIVLWGVSYACLGNITTALSEFMLSDPKPYPELGLMVFPFDSASLSIRAACGKVPREQFLKAQTSQSQEFLYRIAILHHHPLPIPYDDAQEDMLILHNAGAFLQEMSKRQVRLILHGHKHHHCFSRVTINAGTEKAFEVGVLAAGTPSAGKRPGRSGYHFNVLRLDPEGNLAVTPYTALDGAFEAGEAFFVEGRELGTKRMYEQNRAVTGRRCASVVSIRKISPDGDLYHKMEYRGFRIEKGGDLSDGLPTKVSTTTGHIEGFDAGPLPGGQGLPATTLQPDRADPATYSLRSQEGRVLFGRTLEKGDKPVDFFFHYHGINAYAMSARQYQEMYRSQTAPPVESAEVVLQDTPAEELRMLIQFPAGFTIDGYPQLVIEGAPAGSLLRPKHELQEALVYDTLTNMIVLRIPHPALRVCYRIEWRLVDQAPPTGYQASSLGGQAREIANLLQRQPPLTPEQHPLRAMLLAIEAEARQWFKLGDATADPLDVSIMVYDESEHLLKTCAGNFPAQDPRWTWTFSYGDGIAGRAHKMNKARVFVKEYAVRTRTPYYYYPPWEKPVVNPWEIEEEALVAIPLNHPQHPDEVYAILNVGSRRPGSKLVEVQQQEVESTAFRQAVNETCFAALKRIESLLKQRPREK